MFGLFSSPAVPIDTMAIDALSKNYSQGAENLYFCGFAVMPGGNVFSTKNSTQNQSILSLEDGRCVLQALGGVQIPVPYQGLEFSPYWDSNEIVFGIDKDVISVFHLLTIAQLKEYMPDSKSIEKLGDVVRPNVERVVGFLQQKGAIKVDV